MTGQGLRIVRTRNERRARAGKDPLDVEAEVARILAAGS